MPGPSTEEMRELLRRTGGVIGDDGIPIKNELLEVTSVAFSKDDSIAISRGLDGVHVFNLKSASLIKSIVNADRPDIGFSPDGTALAVCVDRRLTIWRTRNWSKGPAIASQTWFRQFSPDSSLIATHAEVASDNVFSIWSVKSGALVRTITCRSGYDVCFTNDSKSMITGGSPVIRTNAPVHNVSVWDIGSGQLQVTIADRFILSFALGNDGHTIITGHKEGNSLGLIKVWDLADGRPATSDELVQLNPVSSGLKQSSPARAAK